jgi:ABC-type glycerol-3-phosphate transport system substrate-binding protein
VPYLPKDLTWEKYIEIAKKLTIYKNKDDKIPEIFGAQGALLDVIIWEKGGRAMNKDGTKCLLNSKEVVDSLCFLHDLIYKHKVEPTATMSAGVTTSDGKRSAYSWLCDNRLAIGFGARWYLMVMRPYFKNRRKEMEAWKKEHPGEEYKGPKPYRFGACLVPRFKDGPRYTLANGRGAGINASSPNAEKALKFLQYAASKEYAEQIIEIADCKPPNKNFHKKELFYSKEYPEEKEIHDISVESIKYGRMDELSPFIDNTIVARQIKDLEAKVRSNKDLTRDGIQELADYSAEKINHRIAENISKNKRLQLFYKKVLEQGGEPALYYNSGKEKEK